MKKRFRFSPDDVVEDVTPWRKAMSRVLIGMALCAITLNFWCLNYILPAVGMVLSLLGFVLYGVKINGLEIALL